MPLPVEVRYDEFTEDILANRLVKAAADRLARIHLRSVQARRNLGWLATMLEDVSLVEFRANCVPAVRFDRLNEHYRGVVELSRLVLQHGAFESGRGAVSGQRVPNGYERRLPGIRNAGVTGSPKPFRARLSLR